MPQLRSSIMLAASLALLLSACGDKDELGQATTYKQGKYQGKPDARPYEAAPGAYSQGSQWSAGDRAGWEAAMKRRQQGQNEYVKAE